MDNNTSSVNFNFKSNDFNDGNFFKSSFARTMALENSHGSKSLDYMYFDRATNISEESEEEGGAAGAAKLTRSVSPTYQRSGRKLRGRSSDAAKFWKRRQDSFKKEASLEKQSSVFETHSEESLEEELARLRKERDHLLEENRRLQDERAESPSLLEVSAFQSQLDTLQWQLKHVESNREMYRAVMEQVLKFLERVQKCLDLIRESPSKSHQSPSKSRSRVPRSRSVHTVAHTSPNSRASSPSPTHRHTLHHVQRASSVHHMQDSMSQHSLRELSWRSSRPLQEDQVTPDKLSQETFRLVRTIQSLMGTREPALAPRLTPSSSDLTLSDPRHAPDSNSVGSCSSLLHSSYMGGTSNDSAGTRKSLGSSSSELGTPPRPRPCKPPPEDESGFSSLSSFHESGLPLPELRTCPELGLPLVDTVWPRHPPLGQSIRVLWV